MAGAGVWMGSYAGRSTCVPLKPIELTIFLPKIDEQDEDREGGDEGRPP